MPGSAKSLDRRCHGILVTLLVVLLSSSHAFSAPELITGRDVYDPAPIGPGPLEFCGDGGCSGTDDRSQTNGARPNSDLVQRYLEAESSPRTTGAASSNLRRQAPGGLDRPNEWSAVPDQIRSVTMVASILAAGTPASSAPAELLPSIDDTLSNPPQGLPSAAYVIMVLMMLAAATGLAIMLIGTTGAGRWRRAILPNRSARRASGFPLQRRPSRWSPGSG